MATPEIQRHRDEDHVTAATASPRPGYATAYRRWFGVAASQPAVRAFGRAIWWLAPAAVLTVLGWNALAMQPGPGLGPSWAAGLQMAVDQHLNFGTQAIWTYGPLGFLTVPGFWEPTLGELGFLYAVLLRLCITVAVYRRLRQTLGRIAAFLVCLVAVSVGFAMGMAGACELVLLGLVPAWILEIRPAGHRATVLAAAFGAFAGVEMLVKVSVGFTAVVMIAILAVALPGRRRDHALAAAAAFVVTLLVLWAAADQAFSALPHYLLASLQVTAGYKQAMGTTDPALAWQYSAALLGLAAGVWAALRVSRDQSARRRYGLLAVWCMFWFGTFSEGFIRHDPPHADVFFGALLLGSFCFRWERRDRGVMVAAAATLTVLALAVQSVGIGADLTPLPNLRAFVSNAAGALKPSRESAIEQAGRLSIEANEPIESSSLALLKGRTVAAYPYEIAQIWAYGLKWDPFPVLQSYSAYTTALDSDDATFLTQRQAPQRIILGTQPAIDNRIGSFDEGLMMRAMLCRYTVLQVTATYAVLGRIANRCTAPARLVKSVRADWGVQVPVPAPPRGHWIVYVRINGTAAAGLERLVSLFYKPPERFIQLNSGFLNRLVTGTADDGLLLDASAGVDYPAPFNLAQAAKRIAVQQSLSPVIAGPEITYSFYEQPVAALPRAAGRSTSDGFGG